MTGLVLTVALLLAAGPLAHGGAVFEIREEVPTNSSSYLFNFTQTTHQSELGSIVGSKAEGAGLVFKSSAIPLAIYTLARCTAVAAHIHPNGAETLFVLEGAIRISQYRGEEDGSNVRVTDVLAGQAGYIQQGAYHVVQNINPNGTTRYLQILDHPQAGTVFAAPAMLNLPRNVIQAAFSEPVPMKADLTAVGPLVKVQGCQWEWQM